MLSVRPLVACVKALERRAADLQAENDTLRAVVDDLRSEVAAARAANDALGARVTALDAGGIEAVALTGAG